MSTAHLLTHLQNTEPAVPLPTLLAALSHHLSTDTPTPTTLAAAAISSPFFLVQPEIHDRLQGLLGAFRHAVHLKRDALVKAEKQEWSITRAIFSKGVQWRLRDWIEEVLRGVQGGRAVLRLACCSGLLLGAKAVKGVYVDVEKVEDDIVIALAEVMDIYAHHGHASEWEREFQPWGEIPLTLALILASQSIPLLSATKLKALPLPFLANLLSSTICSTFQDGKFLGPLDQMLSPGGIHVMPTSQLAQRIKSMSSSPAMVGVAGLSKLTAVTLGTLVDSSSGSLREAADTLSALDQIAANVESDWKISHLATVRNEEEIAPDTRELSRSIWLLLKTLLFSIIMVADGALASVVYVRPGYQKAVDKITPQTLAQSTLQALFHISFVVSKLGGVTATSTGEYQGFKELQRVFYLAIDILSSGPPSNNIGDDVNNVCENFIETLVIELNESSANSGQTPGTIQSFDQAKAAYVLACMEQLVPQLGARCLRDRVWAVCLPYLTDSSHRGTFESAHSVVLSIFASHAQQQQSGHPPTIGLPETSNHAKAETISRPNPGSNHRIRDARDYQVPGTPVTRNSTSGEETHDAANFVQQTIPFYAQCLIENSGHGKLSTAQLRLAYAALVRGASANAVAFGATPDGSFSLAWYCIEVLLDMIRKLTPTERGTGIGENISNEAQLHSLHLTLISTIASLPLPLMTRALEEICTIITRPTLSDSGVPGVGGNVEIDKKQELVKALFTEILEGVGDREKQAAMRWWYANRKKLAWSVGDTITYAEGKGIEKMEVAGQEDDPSAKEVVSRL